MANKTLKWLRDACQQHLRAEKWLICNSQRNVQTWKDRIALAGTPTVNLHGHSLRSAVLSLANQWMVENGLSFVSQLGMQSLLLAALSRRWEENQLQYFTTSPFAENLASLLARSITDLRLAGVEPSQLEARHFSNKEKAADLRLLYSDFIEGLHASQLVDYAACLQQVIFSLSARSLPLPQDLIVLLPEPWQLTMLEQLFLLTLEKQAPIHRYNNDEFDTEAVRTRLQSAITNQTTCFDYFTGHGEINEVRGVMQRILHAQTHSSYRRDEVELAHTDSSTYIPLVYEFFSTALARRQAADDAPGASEQDPTQLPVTFAEGIACIYSRPGRALRAWLRWIRGSCIQSRLVQMLREGLLVRPGEVETIGYARLASHLRRLPIGFQLERYLPAIRRAIEDATKRQTESQQDAYDEGREPHSRDYGLPVLHGLEQMIRQLVELHVDAQLPPAQILKQSKQFLLASARSENKLDRLARNQLLNEIDERLRAIEWNVDDANAILHWLEELPVRSTVLASGPQPGRLHVTAMDSIGISGRPRLFIVGMDAGRYPKRRSVDPFLLDEERTSLSPGLSTATQQARERQAAMWRGIDRALDNETTAISFSFSTHDLVNDRGLDPSPSLVELFRVTNNHPDAHQAEVLQHIGSSTSFASGDPMAWLDRADQQLARYLLESDAAVARQHLERQWSHFSDHRVAAEQRASDTFTEYDGLVIEAGNALDPVGSPEPLSASRLETYGHCPRRFFFRHGLGVYMPDSWDADPEQWLDAIQRGNLLHSLFENFLGELTKEDRAPRFEQDWARLQSLLQSKLLATRERYPVPNEDAYLRECDMLAATCEMFLRKEEEYCEQWGAKPCVLEASIGLKEKPRSEWDLPAPIKLTLVDGRTLSMGGRIDRIDRFQQQGSECYVIWDYKTGSTYGYDAGDPFQQGRKLQPFLYLSLLRHRLSQMGREKQAAHSFGFFFPSVKAAGLRLQWTFADLRGGDEILQLICDLVQKGVFPATTNLDDCKFCDYQAVCSNLNVTTADSLRKSTHSPDNEVLSAWKALRQAV